MTEHPEKSKSIARHVIVAFSVAFAFALGVYLLIQATRPEDGVVAFSFLILLPGCLCAVIAYLADPWRDRPARFYRLIPVWMLLAVTMVSAVVLKEGVVCIVLLAPLWLISGLIGAEVMYQVSRRATRGTNTMHASGLLLIPLLAMQIEPLIPLPQTYATVTRSVDIGAAPQKIWPLLEGVPDVGPGEGRWNFTQDIIGIPRPIGARLTTSGLGGERLARWQHDIAFRERIIAWKPNQQIGWRFYFDDMTAWHYTDRHLLPDSPYFRVVDGKYDLERLANGKTRVTLTTRYWIKTPVNGYSRIWGEVFLGDIHTNVLGIIQDRAER